jgi:hypothetical protein
VIFERIVYSDLMDLIRAGDAAAVEAWIQRCIDDGAGYASPADHRAMVEAEVTR